LFLSTYEETLCLEEGVSGGSSGSSGSGASSSGSSGSGRGSRVSDLTSKEVPTVESTESTESAESSSSRRLGQLIWAADFNAVLKERQTQRLVVAAQRAREREHREQELHDADVDGPCSDRVEEL
jgi:hypothetical protein